MASWNLITIVATRQQAITWTHVKWSPRESCCIHLRSFWQEMLDIYLWYEFQNYYIKITAASPKGQQVKCQNTEFFFLLKYWCCHCILQLLYAWPSRRSTVSSDDKIAIYFLKTAQVAGSTSQPRVSRCHQFQVWMPYHSELLYWLMVATDIDDGWGWGEVTGITWRDQTCSLDYWEKFMLKSMLFNKYFSNMASDWLAGAASQSEARFEIFC